MQQLPLTDKEKKAIAEMQQAAQAFSKIGFSVQDCIKGMDQFTSTWRKARLPDGVTIDQAWLDEAKHL